MVHRTRSAGSQSLSSFSAEGEPPGYQSRMDGMHFEVAVLQRNVTPQASPGQFVASATAGSVVTHDIAAGAIEPPPSPAAPAPPTAPA